MRETTTNMENEAGIVQRLRDLSEKNRKETTLERINSFLEKQYNTPVPYKQKPGHSPSGLGAKCLRKIYYNYFKVEKDIATDVKSARIFATGDAYEDLVMVWLKAVGEHIPYVNKSNGKIPINRRTGLLDPQFPISYPDYGVRKGLIDNVAYDSSNELWTYEIKSSKAEKFDKLTQPMPEHLIQAGIYLKAMIKMLKEGSFDHIKAIKKGDLPKGVKYIYVNKNTSELKIFEIKLAQFSNIYRQLDAKMNRIKKYTEPKILPPKTNDYCAWCPFRIKCKQEWNDII